MTPKTRIFLVDDDPIFRLLTKKTIANIGVNAEVVEFVNGQHVMEYLEQHMDSPAMLPDSIFLDLSMPVMDGWGFLREYEILLPFLRKSSKLYILSSSMSPIDVERGRNIPFVKDYLVKPLNKIQLAELITPETPARYHVVGNGNVVVPHSIFTPSPAVSTVYQWRKSA